ncbi:MAG: response regulator [Lautropia sp.]
MAGGNAPAPPVECRSRRSPGRGERPSKVSPAREICNSPRTWAVAGQLRPSIVLADIRLQDGESGFDAVTRLRERLPDLPVLLISGETSPERLRDADALGAPLLVKPVDPATLLGAIDRLRSAGAR